MEGPHGQLRAGLANRLRRDHAHRLAQLHQVAGSEVPPVAHDANAPPGLAGQHRTDLHPFNAGPLNRTGKIFGDLLVDIHDQVAFVILDLLQRDPADNAVSQRLDDLAAFHDRAHVDAVHRPAIRMADDDVLRDVDQTAGQVAGVGGLQRRIGQPFAGPVGGDEVLQHGEALAEIGRDRSFDNLSGGFRHQSAHAAELPNLLLGAAGAGIGHDVNRIEDLSFFIRLLHRLEHFIGDFFGDVRPDGNHLVIPLAVGDGAVQVLLLHGDHFLLSLVDQLRLAGRDDQVVDPDRNARLGGIEEPDLLDLVQQFNRRSQAEVEVTIIDQMAQTFLFQQAVDVRHIFRKMIVQNHPAHRGFQHLALEGHRLRAHDILIVISFGQVNHRAGKPEANRGEGLHLLGLERQHHLLGRAKRPAFSPCAMPGLGQVVASQHDVLRGNRDRLSVGGGENVVGAEHQHVGLNLSLRRQRNVNRHLVAVKIGVESRADQRVNLDGLALDQNRLKSLNPQTVKGRGPVEQDGVIANDLFQDVPHQRVLLLHHLFGLLDGGAKTLFFELLVDERLE